METCVEKLPDSVQSQIRSDIFASSVTNFVIELVENAIHAKATSIAVCVNLKTFRLQIIDNGIGLTREQLITTGTRYCTTKWDTNSEFSDNSFGYRGETLASLKKTSSRLMIISRFADDVTYCKIFDDTGASSVLEALHQRVISGTTIIADNVLGNVPVRQARIVPSTELHKMKQYIQATALVYPWIYFSLRDDSKKAEILKLRRTGSTLRTFKTSFPGVITNSSLVFRIVSETENVKMKAMIYGELSKNKSLQFVFVNKHHIVKSDIQKFFSNMLSKGFSNTLVMNESSKLKNRQKPIFILNVLCPNSECDLVFESMNRQVAFKYCDKIKFCLTQLANTFFEQRGTSVKKAPKKPKHAPAEKTAAIQNVFEKFNNANTLFGHPANRVKNYPVRFPEEEPPITEALGETINTPADKEISSEIYESRNDSTIEKRTTVMNNQENASKVNVTKTPYTPITPVQSSRFEKLPDDNSPWKDCHAGTPKNNPACYILDTRKISQKFQSRREMIVPFEVQQQRSPRNSNQYLYEMKKRYFLKKEFKRCRITKNRSKKTSSNKDAPSRRKNVHVDCDRHNKFGAEKTCNYLQNKLSPLKEVPNKLKTSLRPFRQDAEPQVASLRSKFDKSRQSCQNRKRPNKAGNILRAPILNYDQIVSSVPTVQWKPLTVLPIAPNPVQNTNLFLMPNEDSKLEETFASPYFNRTGINNFTHHTEVQREKSTTCELLNAGLLYNAAFPKFDTSTASNKDNRDYRNKQNLHGKLYQMDPQQDAIFSSLDSFSDIEDTVTPFCWCSCHKNYENCSPPSLKKDWYNNVEVNSATSQLSGFSSRYFEENVTNCVKEAPSADSVIEPSKSSQTKKNLPMIFDKPNFHFPFTPERGSPTVLQLHDQVVQNQDPSFNIQIEDANLSRVPRHQSSVEVPQAHNLADSNLFSAVSSGKCFRDNEGNNYQFGDQSCKSDSQLLFMEKMHYRMNCKLLSAAEIYDVPKGMLDISNMQHRNITGRPTLSDGEKQTLRDMTRSYSMKNHITLDNEGHSCLRIYPYLKKNENLVNRSFTDSDYIWNELNCGLVFTKSDLFRVKFLKQVDQKFLLATLRMSDTDEEVVVIFDQHAVEERIRVERLLKKYTDVHGVWKWISINPPIYSDVTLSDLNILKDLKANFEAKGLNFELTEIKGESNKRFQIAVVKVPLCFHNKASKDAPNFDSCLKRLVESLIKEIMEQLVSARGCVNNSIPDTLLDVVNSEACRGAIKFGDKLPMEVCVSLLKNLSTCVCPFQCAHGRPSIAPLINFTKVDELRNKNVNRCVEDLRRKLIFNMM